MPPLTTNSTKIEHSTSLNDIVNYPKIIAHYRAFFGSSWGENVITPKFNEFYASLNDIVNSSLT